MTDPSVTVTDTPVVITLTEAASPVTLTAPVTQLVVTEADGNQITLVQDATAITVTEQETVVTLTASKDPVVNVYLGVLANGGNRLPSTFSSDDLVSLINALNGAITKSQLAIALSAEIEASTTGMIEARDDLAQAIEDFDAGMLTVDAFASRITQAEEAITLSVSRLDVLDGSIATANINITDVGIRLTASEGDIDNQEARIVAQQELTSSQWTVKIQENGDGSAYTTGVGLLMYPDLVDGAVVDLDEYVWFEGEAYKAKIAHVSSIADQPPNFTYWELIPYGTKSSFGVLAETFFVQTSAGNQSAVFLVQDGYVSIDGSLMASGSISAAAMIADDVYTLNLESNTWGSPWLPGFKFDSNTGEAQLRGFTLSFDALEDKPDFIDIIHTEVDAPIAAAGLTSVWGNVTGAGKPADNADVTDYPSITAEITLKAGEAQDAAEAYALAQSSASEVSAKAYADGIVTTAEAAAITSSNAYSDTRKTEALAYADGIVTLAEQAAITSANTYSDAAEAAAIVTAKAYADGVVSTEEARAIADATAKANAAQTAAISAAAIDATDKVAVSKAASDAYTNAAKVAAELAMTAYTDGQITIVEAAAIASANAYADARKVEALAYTDGEITTSEAASILAANNYADAKKAEALVTAAAYVDGEVSAEETRAIADAAAKSATAKAEAIAAAAADATAKSDAAISTAAAYTLAQKALAETTAAAYADGIVSAEEARAIADATNKAEAARVAAESAAAIDASAKADAVRDYLDAQFISATSYSADLAEIQGQIDKSITTWFQDGVPTLANTPASDWTTEEDKAIHLKDLYYDNLTGFAYRFQGTTGSYSWVKITDSDVTKALSDAAEAKDTADQKRRVFVATPVIPYDAGDLWDVGGSPRTLKRCSVTRTSGGYVAGDWLVLADTTDYVAAAATAQTKADAAQAAAASYTLAQKDLAETVAAAYADGIVTTAEASAIATAQTYADTKKAEAIAAASADATSKANAAETTAASYADGKATTTLTSAQAYADAIDSGLQINTGQATKITYAGISVPYLSALNGNMGTLTAGQINFGSYTGYAWPAAGLNGAHVSAGGILLGNANNGKYIQFTQDGGMYAPGLTIANGSATFSGNVAANTITTNAINRNAVTDVYGISYDPNATGSTTIGSCVMTTIGNSVFINMGFTWQATSALALHVKRDGVIIKTFSAPYISQTEQRDGVYDGVGTLSLVDTPSAATHTYTIQLGGGLVACYFSKISGFIISTKK